MVSGVALRDAPLSLSSLTDCASGASVPFLCRDSETAFSLMPLFMTPHLLMAIQPTAARPVLILVSQSSNEMLALLLLLSKPIIICPNHKAVKEVNSYGQITKSMT